MTISQFRKLSLFSLIGFLSLTALIAITSIIGGDFGTIQVKIILTTLTISGASICAMSCSAFIEKRSLLVLGGPGIAITLLAAVLVISAVWAEISSVEYWKTTSSLIVLSVAFAHILLLQIPVLAPAYRWSQLLLALFASILALQIIFVIFGEIHAIGYYRLIGVSSVLVVLFTLVVPICLKLPSATSLQTTRLELLHESDDLYLDPQGHRYRVTKL